MYSLNLLGGAVLEGPDGPVSGRASHKRRLAVLAVLALARGRTVPRERVIGLLWADHPGDGARHLLSETLYVLRKELGDGSIIAAGDEIGLSHTVVRCDAAEMEAALDEGDAERAAGLYRGPFLDGFVVGDAPEFERWAEGERERLARVHARAVECLADACEAAGRMRDAVVWWRRLAVQDPYNGRVALRLMRALDAVGERAAALWFAQTHTALLREELGTEPDAELAALAERLRAEPTPVPAPIPEPEPVPAPEAVVEPAFVVEPLSGVEREHGMEPEPVADPAPAAADPQPVRLPSRPLPSTPRPAAVLPPRRVHRFAAAAAGLAVGLLSAAFGFGADTAPPPESGYDPRRIAVLYFDDHSPGGELGYLASGLTEALIHALAEVEALDVISRNGVKPYRDASVRFDSMAADLRAGSIVEGSVQPFGDSVRLTVQLIDANANSHLESLTLAYPLTEALPMQEALSAEVAGFLRRRLGRQIEVRRVRAETRSEEAWRAVMQAERARDDAATLARSRDPVDAASADRLLAQADSLLALAERTDPAWPRPMLLRGWLAHRRALRVGPEGASADPHTAPLATAERVLELQPGHAGALELRGAIRFHAGVSGADSARQLALLDGAERDLRAAVVADPSLASAWATLSKVLGYRGRFAEADLTIRRALAEDSYLEGASDVLRGLFSGALFTGSYAEAGAVCDEGRRRFPDDWRFHECRLTLMREDTAAAASPAAAWAVMRDLERVDPPARAVAAGRSYTPAYRLAVTAAILARAGAADSARAVLARARRAVGTPEDAVSLDYDEAYVRLLLGERQAARRLLESVLAERPALRPFAERDPLLAGLLPPRPTGTPTGGGRPPSRRPS